MRQAIILLFSVLFLIMSHGRTLAHVVVKPGSVGIGSWQTFSVGVPVEKESPTASLRLVIPNGLEYVTPNVKPGWTIEIKKEGEGESAKVTELIWRGGSIPPGQRDDFLFSAKVPGNTSEIHWKAYQTYADGSTVAWDQSPSTDAHAERQPDSGPYSTTRVIDDLKSEPTKETPPSPSVPKKDPLLFLAIGLSVAALIFSVRKR